nr:hypothetical protein CFP56_01811 [Quercus suber]
MKAPSFGSHSHSHSAPPNRLNARRSVMTNSLVRIGGVEGDFVKRALAALIRPSSYQQWRRVEFQLQPSWLSVLTKAAGSVIGCLDLSLCWPCLGCGGQVVQWVYAVDLCGGGFESVVVVWVSMWVPSVVAGFESVVVVWVSMWVPSVVAGSESVVVVWVLAGLLNRWWLWVVESLLPNFLGIYFTEMRVGGAIWGCDLKVCILRS